jgi:hypothetical protein
MLLLIGKDYNTWAQWAVSDNNTGIYYETWSVYSDTGEYLQTLLKFGILGCLSECEDSTNRCRAAMAKGRNPNTPLPP